MHVGRQPECLFGLFLKPQVQCGQRRAEAERPCREQHVLHRGVDRGTGRARRRGTLEARDDPHRRLMEMLGEVIRSREHALEALGGRPGRWSAGAITVSLTFGSLTTRNRQRCMLPPLAAETPASRICLINAWAPGLASAVASTASYA